MSRVALAAGLLLVACTSSSNGSSPATTGPDAGAPTTPNDAGSIVLTEAGGPNLPYAGYAVFTTGAFAGEHASHSFTASFGQAMPDPTTCGLPVYGAPGCCHLGQRGVPAVPKLPLVGAGTLGFTAAGVALTPTATPAKADDPSYSVDEVATPAFTWKAGDMLTWKASGDVVHAFEVLAPVAIDPPAIVTPVLDRLGPPPTISRSQDFTVTYSPANDGNATVALSILASEDTVICSGPDTGSITMPAATMALITSNPEGFNVARYTASASTNDNTAIETVMYADTSVIAKFTQ